MPIDKTTGEKTCINGCGLLQQNKPEESGFLSYYIPSLAYHKEGGSIVNLGLGYSEHLGLPKVRLYRALR